MTPKISIVIPWHFMENWHYFLTRCLVSIEMQTFKDYEVILTKAGLMPVNSNRAIECAKGDYIKVLYMDDYFTNENSLQELMDAITEETKWLVSGCIHDHGDGYLRNPHIPSYSKDIHTGNNTIGSPSVLLMERKSALLFDERLSWLLDCDLYKRLYDKYGLPTILHSPNIAIGIHKGQTSNIMPSEAKLAEHKLLEKKKYGK